MVVQIRNFAAGMSAQGTRENPLEGRTVVVIDDSRVQRRRLRELYESLGFQCVAEADNGLDGLGVCEAHQPDLVSLDVLMPVMHGVEAVGYIREAGTARHVVLVSALNDLEDVAKLRPKGYTPDAIFSKKDSRESFREVLSNIFLADALSEHGEDSASSTSTDSPLEENSSKGPAEPDAS